LSRWYVCAAECAVRRVCGADFSAKFKDLNEELDITPVVELGEGVGIAMGAYAWVDSLG
jgi:hypothetical protein